MYKTPLPSLIKDGRFSGGSKPRNLATLTHPKLDAPSASLNNSRFPSRVPRGCQTHSFITHHCSGIRCQKTSRIYRTAKKPGPWLFTQKYPNPFPRHVHGQANREDRSPNNTNAMESFLFSEADFRGDRRTGNKGDLWIYDQEVPTPS